MAKVLPWFIEVHRGAYQLRMSSGMGKMPPGVVKTPCPNKRACRSMHGRLRKSAGASE